MATIEQNFLINPPASGNELCVGSNQLSRYNFQSVREVNFLAPFLPHIPNLLSVLLADLLCFIVLGVELELTIWIVDES